ncbi:MAG TPA: hypothetical protein VHH12_14715, partial [Mycobacterium sp.]|nr:hypothetical protein [Mycobacterium sp.]
VPGPQPALGAAPAFAAPPAAAPAAPLDATAHIPTPQGLPGPVPGAEQVNPVPVPPPGAPA